MTTYELLIKLGYDEKSAKMISNNIILGLRATEMLQKDIVADFKYLVSLGYKKETVIRITRMVPTLFCLNPEGINDKIEDIMALVQPKEKEKKTTEETPSVLEYTEDTLDKKIEDLKGLGYTREEAIEMTKRFPKLCTLSVDNMNKKINSLRYFGIYGYTREEVIEMTKKLPKLFNLSNEIIEEKIKLYDLFGLHELAIKVPQKLMQSAALSNARYSFFLDRGVEINMSNYGLLFYNGKTFETKYKISKEELLKKYPYDPNYGKKLVLTLI